MTDGDETLCVDCGDPITDEVGVTTERWHCPYCGLLCSKCWHGGHWRRFQHRRNVRDYADDQERAHLRDEGHYFGRRR